MSTLERCPSYEYNFEYKFFAGTSKSVRLEEMSVFWDVRLKVLLYFQGRFGIIFDAGGSGTRMVIYEYQNHSSMNQVAYIECEGQ